MACASSLGAKLELTQQPVKTTMTKTVCQWLRVALILVLLKASSVQHVWSESRQKKNKSRVIYKSGAQAKCVLELAG